MITYNGQCYFTCSAVGFPNCEANKTLCCWLNVTDLASLQGIWNAVDVTNGRGYQLGMRNGSLCVWNYGGTAVINTTVPANTWFHCAYTYTATTSTFYINGVSSATSAIAVQTGSINVTQIGGNQWTEYLRNMSVEDVRIYNRVLTVNEIQTIAQCNTQDLITDGLVGWWPHEEGLGITMGASDIKEIYGRTHTLVGSTPYPISSDSVRFQQRVHY